MATKAEATAVKERAEILAATEVLKRRERERERLGECSVYLLFTVLELMWTVSRLEALRNECVCVCVLELSCLRYARVDRMYIYTQLCVCVCG